MKYLWNKLIKLIKLALWILLGIFAIGILGSMLPSNKNTSIEQSIVHKQHMKQLMAEHEKEKEYNYKYKIIKKHDYSFNGRKRIRWGVYAEDVKTTQQRKELFIQVARECVRKENADQCHIFIEPLPYKHIFGKGISIAIGSYTPDGKGNSGQEDAPVWELEVSNQVFTKLELSLMSLWYKHKEKFRGKDGLIQEKKLYKFISKKLKVKVDDLQMPWIIRKKIVI